jgi:nucleolar GTP-binding protein
MHPFEKFHRVPKAQEIIDYAFKRATTKGASTPATVPKIERIKRTEVRRIENTVELLIKKIKTVIEQVPNLDELPLFFRRLSHILVNNDEFRKNLGRINGVVPVLQQMSKDYCHRIWTGDNAKQCGEIRIEFFGRVASLIRKQEETLDFLETCRKKLQTIPPLNLQMPSVVVAGYPNVGKSSLVGQLSKAHPTVAAYPFTTKQIFFGIYEDATQSRYFQVIDTPGILDRPMAERNEIEKQAILALNTVATIVIFVFDPTLASGYELSHQVQLYQEIQKEFLEGLNVPIKIVINKIDFATEKEISSLLKLLKLKKTDVFLTNAKDGVATEPIVKWILEYLKEKGH